LGMYTVYFLYTVLLLSCLYSGILSRVGSPWTNIFMYHRHLI